MNDLHLNHQKIGGLKSWVVPKILGQPPPPLSEHSSTLADSGKFIVYYGGSLESGLLEDIYLFNTSIPEIFNTVL